MTTTYFPNGMVLDSSALTPNDMDALFQLHATQLLGIAADLEIVCSLEYGNPVVTTPLVAINIQVGFWVVGMGIPLGTFVKNLSGQGSDLLIELNNAAFASGLTTLSFYDPASNTRVKLSWQTEGQPAYKIDDDVLFIRCVEDMIEYNEIRNETVTYNGDGTASRERQYTRRWNVFFRARGPNSFDTIRLIKSMLLEDYSHDALASQNLYLITSMNTPVRMPEIYEGSWWEQVDFSADFLESVYETFQIPTVSGVEVIGFDEHGQIFDIKPVIKG